MKKTEFDPLQWVKDGYCESPEGNPYWMAVSIADQVTGLMEEYPNNDEIQGIARLAGNMAATIGKLFHPAPSGSTGDQPQPVREAVVMAYELGFLARTLWGKAYARSDIELINAIAPDITRRNAIVAAHKRHSKPGGSRDLRRKIREVWATGKYSSRDVCAEEEWRALGFGSFSAARKALRNTPKPT